MAHNTTHTEPAPKVFRTLHDDLRRGDFFSSMRRDFRELKEFMLDEQGKKRLSEMGLLKKWLYTAWWLLKSMFFKLTPARRILLVVGLILLLASRTVIFSEGSVRIESDTNGLAILCIVFVLMLELKDKLVAKEELEAGRAVQEALMPERSPSVSGWSIWLFTRPANEVGGDLVEFVRAGESRYGIALGDVAGKGLRAALLMAKLQATLKALAPDFPSLAELGRKLNEIFCRDGVRGIFASLMYIELQPGSNAVRLVNAGHIPPMIVRNGEVTSLARGGVALGLTPDATFEEMPLKLERGDVLCAYSDGLTEAQNERGEFFGEQRLSEMLFRFSDLPVEQFGEALVANVDRFTGSARRHDDLSIALIIKS